MCTAVAFDVLLMTVCAEHIAQAVETTEATASESLLESLDDSDDDFGGQPAFFTAASVALPRLQPDAVLPDTVLWRVQLMAAEAPRVAACEQCLAEAGLQAEPTCSITSEQVYRQMPASRPDARTLDSRTPVDNALQTTHLWPTLCSLLLHRGRLSRNDLAAYSMQ